MKLRFEIDQAECFRAGINAPNSIVTIEVDPAKVEQADRWLIADHLKGIDVMGLDSKRIIALTPDIDGLIKALRSNHEIIPKLRELQ